MTHTAMSIAALTWPAAVVYVALIVTAGFVLIVTIWSIFRTGQTAIRNEDRQAVRPHTDLRESDARA